MRNLKLRTLTAVTVLAMIVGISPVTTKAISPIDGHGQERHEAKWYFATHSDKASDPSMYTSDVTAFWPEANNGIGGYIMITGTPEWGSVAGDEKGKYSTNYDAFEYTINDNRAADSAQNQIITNNNVEDAIRNALGNQEVSMFGGSNEQYSLKFTDPGVSVKIMRIKQPTNTDKYYHIDCWITRAKTEGVTINYFYDNIKKEDETKTLTGNVGSVVNIAAEDIRERDNARYKLASVTADGQALSLDNGKYSVTLKEGDTPIIVNVYYDRVYTVRFDLNAKDTIPGSIDSQIVKKGEKAVAPADVPTREGFNFKGWFKENTTSKFDFQNTEINEDTTLVAQWEEIQSNDEPVQPGQGNETKPNPGNQEDPKPEPQPPVVDNPISIDPLPLEPVATINDDSTPLANTVIKDDDTPLASTIEDEDVILEDADIDDDNTSPADVSKLNDDDVPLADMPKTGQLSVTGMYALAATLLAGIALTVTFFFKKRKI